MIPESSVHPVAAIMPGIANPVTYHTANERMVVEGSDSSDDEVSVLRPNCVGTFLESVEAVVDTPIPGSGSLKEILPLVVPHLF